MTAYPVPPSRIDPRDLPPWLMNSEPNSFARTTMQVRVPATIRQAISLNVKGDANYRRLVGEYHWLPTASFQRVTAYFPAPLVALRTLKCELTVGLHEGESERLSRQDPQWLINGKRGVVQAMLKDE